MAKREENERIVFADEDSDEKCAEAEKTGAWKILIVDDDEEVHRITSLALKKFSFDGRGLSYLNAYSGREAMRVIPDHPDIAVILLDVVMETEHAGLDLVRHIRGELNNPFVRIILRTGHPGQAPERKVISEYDINDYKEKTELTAKKLHTSVTGAIRSFRDIHLIEKNRAELERALAKLEKETEERMHAEEALRQARKMEAIGTLAGGIAHDFNNILMTVMMNIEFAIKKSQGNDLVLESLDLAHKASARARDLVDQILTFSRKSERKDHPLTVSSILRESMKLIRSSLPLTIDIRVEVGSESCMILADPTQIQQVIMNLCSNAAHAMREDGGTLTVSLDKETINESDSGIDPGDYVRLTTKDTGNGMEPDVLERIFDPFFTTKRPGEGTGMGLSVVLGIIEGIGGVVQARSEQGGGSVFDVYIPELEQYKDGFNGAGDMKR